MNPWSFTSLGVVVGAAKATPAPVPQAAKTGSGLVIMAVSVILIVAFAAVYLVLKRRGGSSKAAVYWRRC